MRPVLLELTGFASFRESAVVDFTSADYFALVGPTGAGKSTVIDAMIFALYGTAPRWEHESAVSNALAPTTSRATLRLVFDLAGQRYVVAREVRRVGQAVQSRNNRLERFLDAGATGAQTDRTEPLAAEGAVTAAVEKLLGLSFKQFCQCVVLPQGEFSTFLKAKPAERQVILLQLIGAQHYDEIAALAFQRSREAEARSAGLREQREALGDVSDEALAAASAEQARVNDLANEVAALRDRLITARAEAAVASAEAERLEQEHGVLTALGLPDGVADLDARRAQALTALERTARDEEAAVVAEQAADARLLAAGDPEPLRLVRTRRSELSETERTLPAHRAAVSATGTDRDDAEASWRDARDRLDAAGTQQRRAEAAREALTVRAEELTRRLAALRVPAPPADLAGLDSTLARASEERDAATRDLGTAQARESAAREELRAAPQLEELRDLRRRIARQGELESTLVTARAAAADLAGRLRTADAALASAVVAHDETRDEVARLSTVHVAAGLRPELEVGRECPVCAQVVERLPPVLRVAALAGARARLAAAESAVGEASGTRATAQRLATGAQAVVAAREAELTDVLAELETADWPAARVDSLIAAHAGLTQAADTAAALVRDTVARLRRAADAVEQSRRREAAARRSLRGARDYVAAFAPPDVDDLPLLDGWAELVAWAAQQRVALMGDVERVRAELAAASAGLGRATAVTASATARESEARTRRDQASAAATTALTRFQTATDRCGDLTRLLVGAPSPEAVGAALAEHTQASVATGRARELTALARAGNREAAGRLAALDRELRTARTALGKARDTVVWLGAPELRGEALLRDWTELLTWAGREAAERAGALPAARDRCAAGQRAADEAEARLRERLTGAGLVADAGDLADAVPVALDRAVVAAARVKQEVEARREAAASLTRRCAGLEEERQVSTRLHDLLRSDKFPRWLARAALGTLVADASATLMELSGGQYELDFDDREFRVVDHADADQTRSVKTLSGGELFQASLALALALSSHISQLAVGRAAHLDSIFLDEGFGSLDPDTLETVATTLESLARSERMVGVVTHVTSLAERVPVRFAVTRDAQTSRVVREGG